MRAFSDPAVKQRFQNTVTETLGSDNPDAISTEQLSTNIRSSLTSAARSALPQKVRAKFPDEFSPETIQLIHQKREQWKVLQKSGRRITRSLRDRYRKTCRDTKHAIKLV